MNIKDISKMFRIFVVAFIISWAIQYFLPGGRAVEECPVQEKKPLNTEIDFIDMKRPSRPVTTGVETSWASMVFSTDGATLESLAFKRMINGKDKQLATIHSSTDEGRELRAFLLALPEKTPYYYELVDKKSDDKVLELTYQVRQDKRTITKIFTIHKEKNQVDLKIGIVGSGEPVGEVRLMYPAPLMPELGDDQQVGGLLVQLNGAFEKIPFKSIHHENSWSKPLLFGGDNRYFIHAFVADPAHFVERAYFAIHGQDRLQTILESKPVEQQASWNLSFYLGPKESHAIMAVDPRLEQALDYYGWLSPISKLLLTLLTWLYRYVHNYGLAIILLTILIRLFLLPFSLRGERSVQTQREVQKKLAYLEKKFKNDPERLALERAEFMKKHGLPGLAGCLPLLVQIPIFFALSRILANSIQLYDAPMLWISNLSARDPYYILPFLVFVTLLLQTLSGRGPTPSRGGNELVFGVAMALVFGAITTSLSAGLALYILVSTVLQVGQTFVVKAFGDKAAAQ